MIRLWFEFGMKIFVALTVEFGLMSTTTSREMAVAYSGKNGQRCTVLEITAGRVDVGADISFLSQYPGEKEFLIQPLSCLEVRAYLRVQRPHRDVLLHLNLMRTATPPGMMCCCLRRAFAIVCLVLHILCCTKRALQWIIGDDSKTDLGELKICKVIQFCRSFEPALKAPALAT
jgi:hypothetical protein